MRRDTLPLVVAAADSYKHSPSAVLPMKEDPSVAVFVWHTQTKTLTLIKEFAPGREEVAHGVVAGMYEKNKHDSPLQAAKFEVSQSPRCYQVQNDLY